MKKYLKKLLVVALALMPSLSINTFAQPSGNDPEDIPIKEAPTPNPNPGNGGPRFSPDGYDDAPIVPWPGGNIPHPRVAPGEPDVIPIKPIPDPGPGHEPRNRNSVQIPYCYHTDGVVYIEADATITYINATVTRYDDNQVWSNASNSNTLSITTSGDIGVYLLELTLSNGQSYIGEYIIE